MRTEETEASVYSPRFSFNFSPLIPIKTQDGGVYFQDTYGFIYPWREIVCILRGAVRFYSQYTDEEIDEYNKQKFIKYEEELHSHSPQPSQPKKRTPKPGYVYFLQGENGLIKIGYSQDYKERYKALKKMSPVDIKLLFVVKTDDMVGLERNLHNRFQEKRVKGEWFQLSMQEIQNAKAMLLKAGYEIIAERRKK